MDISSRCTFFDIDKKEVIKCVVDAKISLNLTRSTIILHWLKKDENGVIQMVDVENEYGGRQKETLKERGVFFLHDIKNEGDLPTIVFCVSKEPLL